MEATATRDPTLRVSLAVLLREPLREEAGALALGLELFEDWEAAARQHDNEPLLELLERARAEFSARLERANKVLDDLQAAEFKLMRS